MTLPKDYTSQNCSLSRALEVIGERWTLLLVQDAFFGVRRYGDFAVHLGTPRAVLAKRLGSLVAAGVFGIVPGPHGHDEYILTSKGISLWPIVRNLLAWGDEHCSAQRPGHVFQHVTDSGTVRPDGTCEVCGDDIPVADLVALPGPGLADETRVGAVTSALAEPHRLLKPIRQP
jgi:DNA-binding HxlR family transcriptional regulator